MQPVRVSITFLPIRKVPSFVNLEGSQYQLGRFQIFANPKGSYFYLSGKVIFLQVRWSHILANPKGSFFSYPRGPNFGQLGRFPFCQLGRVPIRRGPIFANPEGSYSSQSGSVIFFFQSEGSNFWSTLKGPFCQIGRVPVRRIPFFANLEGS